MKARAMAAWALVALALGLVAPLAWLLSSWMIGAIALFAGMAVPGGVDSPSATLMLGGAGVLVGGGASIILWAAYRALRPGRALPAAGLAALLVAVGAWLGYLGLARLLAGVSWA